MARTRQFLDHHHGGTRTRSGTTIDGGTRLRGSYTCTDIPGKLDNMPFDVNHWHYSGGVINRPFTSYFSPSFDNYTADVLKTPANFPALSVPDVPSASVSATMAAARTNPSRPHVDVPVMFGELGDVVQLVQKAGRSFFQRVARKNIEFQFGIMPLMSDLAKMTQFQQVMHYRALELNRLRGSKGLRRTVDAGSWSRQQRNIGVYCQSSYATIRRDFDVNTVIRRRVHCRWRPTEDLSHLSVPANMRSLTARAVLGLTVDPSTAWELIPWSWLVDWFTNAGTFLKARRNIVGGELYDCSIIETSSTEHRCDGYDDGVMRMSPISFKRITKLRYNGSVAPVAHFQVLTGRQMGILASLHVLRGGRR
jgi:hypothetical protein